MELTVKIAINNFRFDPLFPSYNFLTIPCSWRTKTRSRIYMYIAITICSQKTEIIYDSTEYYIVKIHRNNQTHSLARTVHRQKYKSRNTLPARQNKTFADKRFLFVRDSLYLVYRARRVQLSPGPVKNEHAVMFERVVRADGPVVNVAARLQTNLNRRGKSYLFQGACWCSCNAPCQSGFCVPDTVCACSSPGLCTLWPVRNRWCGWSSPVWLCIVRSGSSPAWYRGRSNAGCERTLSYGAARNERHFH